MGKCDHVGKLELFRELRLGNSNVAGVFAGREPDRNGDIAFIMPFGAQPITNNPAPQANTGTAPQDVEDKRLLKLIRAFLNAGVMENGLASPSVEGTPQGGPSTPRTQKATSALNV